MVKITVERDVLAKALPRVARVVERRNTIPILSNIMLTTSAMDGTLRIYGTDLDLGVTVTIAAESSDDFTTTVPAQMLSDIVKKMPEGSQLKLEQSDDKRQLIVKAGRSAFKMLSLPSEDYPQVDTATPYTVKTYVDAGILASLLKRVEFAISTEETRYYLNGVFTEYKVENKRPMLRMVATDGHRLAMAQCDAMEGIEDLGKIKPGIIIPRKTVAIIIKMLEDALGEKKVEDKRFSFQMSDTKVRLEWNDTTIWSKLIDGTFPPYERVIPQANNIAAVVGRHDLAEASELVTTIASERGRAVKLTFKEPGIIELEVNNPDTGQANDELSCQYSGPEMAIGFNSRYLADAMKVIEGKSAVINLLDAGSPALIRGEGILDHLVVLMPMRI